MKGTILKALVLSATILGSSTSAWASEYLVKYRSVWGVQSLMTTNKLQVLDQHDAGRLLKVAIPEQNKVMTLLNIMNDPNVEYVVPNARVHTFGIPVQTKALQNQYAIAKIQAEAAWQKAGNRGSRKIVVAVIDTGADYKHKNLAPNMVKGFNFIDNNDNPMDITGQNPGHGTHCSGIIGASGLVDGGTIGVSPEVSIMPLRFLDQNGSGDLNNAVKAIDYAIQQKVDVMSNSWGAAVSRAEAQPIIDAIARAQKAGITFVAAASNDGKDNDSYEVYPANGGISNMITVAASNSSDSKPQWSNYGRKVDIASPGDAIISTLPGDKYGNLSGTSMATPLVAGLVAFLKAQDPSLTPETVRSLLQASGDKVSIETACDCRINASSAVDLIKNHTMFVSPFAGSLAIGSTVAVTGVYGKAPFQFQSSNPSAATIDANGTLTGVAQGETTLTVTDAAGKTATSYKIFVGAASSSDPGQDPGNPGDPGQPGQPGDCPLGDPQLCQMLCQIQPTLPFCNK